MENVISEETYEEKLERERREEKEKNTKVEGLIRAACKILGFTAEKNNVDSRQVSVDAKKGDEVIHFNSGTYYLKDRIEISGRFPTSERGDHFSPYGYGEKRHEITVSNAKNAERIAKDIENRFLPHYRELLKTVIVRVNNANEYARTCDRNLEAIKGKRLTEDEKKNHRFWLSGSITGEVKVSGDDAAIELRSVPIEIARKVIRLINN